MLTPNIQEKDGTSLCETLRAFVAKYGAGLTVVELMKALEEE